MPKFIDKIDISSTAVLCIDMINDFVLPGAPIYTDMGYQMLSDLRSFLDACREKDMRVIYTNHSFRPDGADRGKHTRVSSHVGSRASCVFGTPGTEIHDQLTPHPGEVIVNKHYNSPFYNTELDVVLRANDIKTIVITGVCTDFCCLAAARDGLALDYRCIFLSDLTGTSSSPDCGFGRLTPEQHHIATLNNVMATNGEVMTSEAFLKLLN